MVYSNLVSVLRWDSGRQLCTLDEVFRASRSKPEQRVDLAFVEAYDDLAIYYCGGGGLRVHAHHLLHGVEVGADVLLGELDVVLR